jgi:hypothetical protein
MKQIATLRPNVGIKLDCARADAPEHDQAPRNPTSYDRSSMIDANLQV